MSICYAPNGYGFMNIYPQTINAIHEFWSVIWGTLVLLHKYQISQQKVKIMTFDLWKTGSCVKYDK